MDTLQTNHVHKRTKHIVHGFIHLNTYCSMNIPDLILTLCVLFYNGNDHFIKCSSKMRIGRTTANYTQLMQQGMNWSTTIGSKIIDFKKNPNKLYYQWTILTNTKMIFIGIDSTPNHHLKCNQYILDSNIFNVYNPYKYYGWCSLIKDQSLLVTNDKSCKYSSKFNHQIHGKIKMIINCQKRQIIFIKNNTNYGITFENIDLSQQYHLAISLFKKGSYAQIIDETNKHY